MKRLIYLCGSDPTICDASRVMRLPGSWYVGHDLKVGTVCHLRDIHNHSYKAEQFEALLPELPPPLEPRTPKFSKKDSPSASLHEIADALEFIPSRVPGQGNYPVDRNVAWGLKAAVIEAGYDVDVAEALLEEHSPSRSSGWDVRQILNSGGDAISAPRSGGMRCNTATGGSRMADIQAVADQYATISDEAIQEATSSIQLAQGRDQFNLYTLLPPDLAAAVDRVTEALPADALTSTLTLLFGYSGLLKLGTNITPDGRYKVPCNLYVGLVAPSGLQRSLR